MSGAASKGRGVPDEVAAVGYGNSGGARSIEQLRQVAIELKMVPIRNALHLPLEVFPEGKDTTYP